jgi:hypothetical protein
MSIFLPLNVTLECGTADIPSRTIASGAVNKSSHRTH